MLSAYYSNMIGADPEVFLQKGGRVIGSERVLPEIGLGGKRDGELIYDYPTVVRDGVQAELHPPPQYSGNYLVRQIGNTFMKFETHLKQFPGVKMNFSPMVTVDKKELGELGDEARTLGCLPSDNIYGFRLPKKDGSKYRKRTAGGHLHFSLAAPIYNIHNSEDHRVRTVPILDAVLGNTCVMLDTDIRQIERRKMYGRPGEYRLPRYGLEYRTLSNFWLRSPVLADMVIELGVLSMKILDTTLRPESNQDLETELVNSLDYEKVVQAIMKNDPVLAFENWRIVREFILRYANPGDILSKRNMRYFDNFLCGVNENGLDHYFNPDQDVVLNRWRTVDNETVFFENFIQNFR